MYINMMTMTSRKIEERSHSETESRMALTQIKSAANNADPEKPHIKLRGLIFGSIKKHNPYMRYKLSLFNEQNFVNDCKEVSPVSIPMCESCPSQAINGQRRNTYIDGHE